MEVQREAQLQLLTLDKMEVLQEQKLHKAIQMVNTETFITHHHQDIMHYVLKD
jgi:hypothetical protein